jgi:hypothetical protein
MIFPAPWLSQQAYASPKKKKSKFKTSRQKKFGEFLWFDAARTPVRNYRLHPRSCSRLYSRAVPVTGKKRTCQFAVTNAERIRIVMCRV